MKHPSFPKYALVFIVLFSKELPKYIIRIAYKTLVGVLGVRDYIYD